MLYVGGGRGGGGGECWFVFIHSTFKLLEKKGFIAKLIIPRLFFKPAANRQSTYAERLRMCKVLRGFHVRTITINRAISYMNSGEHTE